MHVACSENFSEIAILVKRGTSYQGKVRKEQIKGRKRIRLHKDQQKLT